MVVGWEGGDVCVLMTDSYCCTVETNNIVKNYTSVKSNKKNSVF